MTPHLCEYMKKLKEIGRKKEILLVAIVLAAVLLMFLIGLLRTYKDFTTHGTYELSEVSSLKYMGFANHLLRYSQDGAFFTTYDGDLIWNETYDMKNPTVDVCKQYILIYDKEGTEINVLTASGRKGKIKTNQPILQAKIASQGTVAVLMQQKERAYLQLYDVDGKVLASGELYAKNNGYPIAIALSEDAKKLAVSFINLNDKDVKTTMLFYDFGRTGKKAKEHIVSSYSFSNVIMPQIQFFEDGSMVAFGDSEIALFSGANKPKLSKEIFLEKPINTVLYNRNEFGIIYNDVDKEGTAIETMTIYSAGGFKKFSKQLSIAYNMAQLQDNGEIILTSDKDAEIYSRHGIKKFAYTFETSIYKIIPTDSKREYIFIRNGVCEQVRLK